MPATESKRWYESDAGSDVSGSVFETARTIAKDLSKRRSLDALFARMYGTDPAGAGEQSGELRDKLDRKSVV